MVTYLEPGDAATTFDLHNLYYSLRGSVTGSGGTPSKGTNAMETDVGSGSGFIDQSVTSWNNQTVIHDAGDTDPRFDIVYLDTSGTAQILKGTPAQAEHPTDNTNNFADVPFEFVSPSPKDYNDFTGTPVALVAIPAGASDYDASKQLRDIRLDPDTFVDAVESRQETYLPEYDEFSNAPQTERSVIKTSGNGTPGEGIYFHNGSEYVAIASGISFSDLTLNSPIDFETNNVTNVGELQVNQSVRVNNGRGTYNLTARQNTLPNSTDMEVYRLPVQAGEKVEIWRVGMAPQGGGATTSDVSFRFEDASDGSVLVETSDVEVGTNSPLATGSAGADIVGYVDNNTGGTYKVAFSGQLTIVEDV